MLGGHLPAAFGTAAASLHAFLHVADPLAIVCAFGADFGAFAAGVPVMG
jgi:hypothetical protein